MNIVFSTEDMKKLEESFETPIRFSQYKAQGNTWYMKGKPDPHQLGVRVYYQGRTKKELLDYYNLVQNVHTTD